MTQTIRLPKQLLKEIQDWLEAQGVYCSRQSGPSLIKTFASHVMYSNLDHFERIPGASTLTQGGGPILQGSVTKFFQNYSWTPTSKAPALDPDTVQTLLETEDELIDQALSKDTEVAYLETPQETPKPPHSAIPPWEVLTKADLNEMQEIYPTLKAFLWPQEDPLKEAALACAFSVCPLEEVKGTKLMELALNLYSTFKEWKEVEDEIRNE